MAGTPKPISYDTFNDLIGRPVVGPDGKLKGHLAFIETAKERQPFVKLYQTGTATALAKDRRANATTLRVYLALLDHINYENTIAVSQRTLADALGIHRAHIAKALQQLTTLGVIERGEKAATLNSYRLNPAYAWKGDTRR